MSQQIEIEFKNILTKSEYEKLLNTFHISDSQIHHQANYYFDTHDTTLKNLKSALRIRQKGHYFECTLKEQTTEHENLETTDVLTEQQATAMLNGNGFFAPSVEKRLNELTINPHQLAVFGSFETNRVEIDYQGGLLVFDHTFYLQQHDYEVEYETTDVHQGLTIFEQFLTNHHIAKRPADKKIARFMKALAASK